MDIPDTKGVSFSERARCFLSGLAYLGIGLFIVGHGQFGKPGSFLVTGFAVMTGLYLVYRMNKGISAQWHEIVEMGTIGTAAMLLGWWADVGFGPILRDGICWCSCVDIHQGWGLPDIKTWMYGGMLASSLLMLPSRWNISESGRFIIMLVGMFAGMFVSEYLLARTVPGDPRVHFLTTIASNSIAMIVGMWIACAGWQLGINRRNRLTAKI